MEQIEKENVKISIITVVLNNREFFHRTAESIISQEAKCGTDWEWIVVDGESTDGTVDEIKRYTNYISFWSSEKDKGIYDAMNKSIAHVKGEYCLFMNAGDWFYDHQVIKNVINHDMYGKCDYLYGDTQYALEGKNVGKPDIYPKLITGKFLFKKTINHQSILMSTKRLVALGGYDTTYKLGADVKFLFQDIVMNNASCTHLNFIVASYDITGASSTHRGGGEDERERLLKELLPERIYDDYKRYCYGETVLERILCKISERSVAYRALTAIAMILYSPVAVHHRLRIRLKKIL